MFWENNEDKLTWIQTNIFRQLSILKLNVKCSVISKLFWINVSAKRKYEGRTISLKQHRMTNKSVERLRYFI